MKKSPWLMALAFLSTQAIASEQVWYRCQTETLAPSESSWANTPVGPFEIAIATEGQDYRVHVKGLYGAKHASHGRVVPVDIVAPTTRHNAVGINGEGLVNFVGGGGTEEGGDLGFLIAMDESRLQEKGFIKMYDGSKSSWVGTLVCNLKP